MAVTKTGSALVPILLKASNNWGDAGLQPAIWEPKNWGKKIWEPTIRGGTVWEPTTWGRTISRSQ
jgi:hypothetical protein